MREVSSVCVKPCKCRVANFCNRLFNNRGIKNKKNIRSGEGSSGLGGSGVGGGGVRGRGGGCLLTGSDSETFDTSQASY